MVSPPAASGTVIEPDTAAAPVEESAAEAEAAGDEGAESGDGLLGTPGAASSADLFEPPEVSAKASPTATTPAATPTPTNRPVRRFGCCGGTGG